MKKCIFILLSIVAVLFISCTAEPVFQEDGKSGTATITFTSDFGTVPDGPGTKAFDNAPHIRNLYLAVFNKDGKALVEYVKAEPVTPASTNDTGKYKYTVTLKLSSQPRVIHFMANAPEEIGTGSDVDAVGNLSCSFDKETWEGDDAYWGYLNLEHGICKETDPGFDELTAALSSVKLVRNFAQIQVEEVAGAINNFHLTRFWISNFPESSSVAPYNRAQRRFETGYASYESSTAAMTAGYQGFRPSSSALVTLKGLSESRLEEIQCLRGTAAYSYECEKTTSDHLCIIVGGTSDLCGDETFYKIDFRDSTGNYIPLLRNFIYKIQIGNVNKVGEPTVEAALNLVSSGAIDTDLSLQDFKDLSNGKSRIAVSETERMLFDNDPFELLYSFVPDVTTGAVVNTTLEQLGKTKEQAETDHDSYVTIGFESGLAGDVIASHSISDADETDGYRKVSLTPVPTTDVVKTEVVTVTGHVYNENTGKFETIQRTVNYQSRKRFEMTLTLTPNEIPEEFMGTIKATIGIEENLPMSIFPLDMKITSDLMTLSSADDNMPMSSGVGADGKPAFFMNRAISWEEYCSTVSVMEGDGIRREHFDCLLKVNTSDFEDWDETFGKGDRVVVTNGAFNTGSAYLLVGNDGLKRFIKPHLVQDYLVPGGTANIVFGMTLLPEDGTITVYIQGMEPVNPASGSGFSGISKISDGVYELTATGTTVMFDVKPTADFEQDAMFWLEDDEFWPSAKFQSSIGNPKFSYLEFNYNDSDYVEAGKTAKVCFHMYYLPEDGRATLHLKNAVPADGTLTGTGPDADGYTSYVIDANKNDVSFEVVISPAVGEDKAYFKLSATGFTDSSVIVAPIR